MKVRFLWVLCFALSTAWGQTPTPQEASARLRSFLATGQLTEAANLVSQIQADPSFPAPDTNLLMLQGALYQEQSRQASDPTTRSTLVDKARDNYTRALKLSPESGAIMSNLALLEASVGADAAARSMFEAAVRAKDDRRATYALNYARYLLDRDPAAARTYAWMAVKASPENKTAHDLLLDTYKAGPRSDLVAFLASELDAGRTTSVLATTLDTLAAPGATGGAGDQLITLAAAAIAADRVLLSAGPGEAAMGKLAKLAQDSDVRAGAAQLRLALTDPPGSLSALGWWIDPAKTQLRSFPTRKSVMRGLLRGLGEQRAKSNPRASEQWLRLAIDAGDQGPDPEAFVRLVETYVNSGQRGRINELMGRYENQLFNEKGGAYMREDWPLIYRMHLALGTTYAYLGQWENNARPTQSASFQLENAKKAAERGNEMLKRQNLPPNLALPPPAAKQLADFYVSKGDSRKAVTLQLDVAKQLRDTARPNESKQVLTAINPSQLKGMGGETEAGFKTLQVDVDRAAREAANKRR
jgi:hypothetical protein